MWAGPSPITFFRMRNHDQASVPDRSDTRSCEMMFDTKVCPKGRHKSLENTAMPRGTLRRIICASYTLIYTIIFTFYSYIPLLSYPGACSINLSQNPALYALAITVTVTEYLLFDTRLHQFLRPGKRYKEWWVDQGTRSSSLRNF